MAVQAFKKKSGTSDEGKIYEHLYLANLIWNLVCDEEIENFHLSSNDPNFGSFDDVVLEIEYFNGNTELYVCQLKQRESDKRVLTKNALAAPQGKFSIKKYFLNYHETPNLQGSTKMILFVNSSSQIQGKIELDFGNKPFEVDILQGHQMKHLKTSENGSCYAFESPNQHADFFKNFFLYTGQAGVQELRKHVQGELKEFFGCNESIFKSYYDFIEEWSMKKGKKCKLDKPMMKRVITLNVLTPHIKPLSFSSKPVSKRTEIFREATSTFSTTIFEECNYEKVKKLWENATWSLHDFENVNRVRIQYQLMMEDIKNLEDLETENKDASKLFWLLEKSPLVLEECPQSHQAIKFYARGNFVLLRSKCVYVPEFRSFETLSDLKVENDIYEKVLDNFTYSLEGQKEATLRHLLEVSKVEDKIVTDDLLEMVDGPMLFGNQEVIPPCHIPRTLSKILIDTRYLRKPTKDTLIIISCLKNPPVVKQRFPDIQFTEIQNFDQEKIDNSGIYFTSNELDAPPKAKHHHFRYLNLDLLEWIQSSNGIDDLQEFRLERSDCTIKESIFYGSFNITSIFCAESGMGKSTLMKSLKANSSSKFWTILLCARNHALHLAEHGANVEKFMEHIVRSTRKHQMVFQDFIRKGHVQIIWDGLDEVFDDRCEAIFEVAKEISKKGIKQFITSRNHLKEELEKKFGAFARRIRQFDEEEQRRYIRERLDLNEEELCQVFKKIKRNVELFSKNDILGVPLQIYMLTELFYRDKSKYLDLLEGVFTVADLYKYFVEEKFKVYYREKEESNLELDANYRRYKKEKERKIGYYKRIAFQTQFCDAIGDCEDFWDEDPVGLIKITGGNIPEFTHNSYGEYFGALYLSEHYESEVRNKDFLFDAKYNNIRFFLDSILAGNCKGHIAVLYKNGKLLADCTRADLQREDKVGRNILTLSRSWNKELTIVRKITHNYIFQKSEATLEKYVLEGSKKICSVPDNLPLTLTKFMLLLPATISMYNLALDNNDYKKFFVGIILYYSIKFNYPLIFDCIESIPWMEEIFRGFHLPPVLEWAINYNFIDALEILVFKYNCHKIILKNFEMTVKMCSDRFSKIFHFLVRNNLDLVQLTKVACATSTASVKFLIDNAAFKDTPDENDKMPIHFACEYGEVETVRLLVDYGVRTDVVNRNRKGVIHYACTNNKESLEIVIFLINKGTELNVKDGFDQMPLHYACQHANTGPSIKLLIESGAKVYVVNKEGKMPLHYACRYENGGIMKCLRSFREKGCPIGFFEILKYLISNGVEIGLAENITEMSIALAPHNNVDFNTIKLLIPNLNVADKKGRTELHYACKNNLGTFETIKLLIDNGAKVDTKDLYGRMPLHYACKHKDDVDSIKLLIDEGSEVNVPDQDGATPIHYAVKRGNPSVVKLLMETDVKDKRNQRLIDYVRHATL